MVKIERKIVNNSTFLIFRKYQKGQYIWGDKYITDGLTKDNEEKSRRE